MAKKAPIRMRRIRRGFKPCSNYSPTNLIPDSCARPEVTVDVMSSAEAAEAAQAREFQPITGMRNPFDIDDLKCMFER
jgi:hypothetical protein